MSNPWTLFKDLLPDTSRWIGKVANPTYIEGKITVDYPDGGTTGLVVYTNETYLVGDYVFIEGKNVISKAPDLTDLYTEEITGL